MHVKDMAFAFFSLHTPFSQICFSRIDSYICYRGDSEQRDFYRASVSLPVICNLVTVIRVGLMNI